jgi:hypothetical protein
MNMQEKGAPMAREKKSDKYKSFPAAQLGLWGPEVRKDHPDQLHEAIMGRIRHVAERLNQYLPPYESNYKVDQSLAFELETAFDELAQAYLEVAKEGYGGYLYPEDENRHYTYGPVIAFDEKLEEIQQLVIDSEQPFYEEKNEEDLDEGTKQRLHAEGTAMLQKAVEKINALKILVSSREQLVA